MPKARPPFIDQYWHTDGIFGIFARAAIRTLQFVFAIIVAAIYGVDLGHATKIHAHANSEWVYAEVVACLSAITCILHCFVTVKRVAWSTWDGVLFVLWLAQTGVFGSIYGSGVRPGYEGATQSLLRMRVGIWIDLVSMLLWFTSTVLAVAWCIRARRVTRRTDQLDVTRNQETQSHVAQDSDYKEVDQRSFRSGSEATLYVPDDENGDENGLNNRQVKGLEGKELLHNDITD